MLNVAIDGKRFFQNASGLGRYSRTLVQGLLAEQWRREIEITLFKPRGKTRFQAPAHPRLVVAEADYHLPGHLGNGLWRFFRLPRLLQGRRYSLFHGPSHVLPLSAGCPMVVTMFDLIFLRFPEYFRRWDRNYYRISFRSAARRADRIISFSKATKGDLINYFAIPEEKISVVYPCLDDALAPLSAPALSAVRNRFRLPERYILYVGTIEPRKNILRTAQAFDLLLTRRQISSDTQFLIVGSQGWFYNDILQGIGKLKHKGQIRLAGPAFDSDLAGIYQLASATAYVSQFEGFGYPVLESLHLGTPVLTAATSSLPEAGGDGALYVNPQETDEIAEGLMHLLNDPQLRQELVIKGRRHAARFTAQRMAAETIQVYRQAAA